MVDYYVRKSGSNSNNGTSPATAWLTVTKAITTVGVTGGDNIYVGAGIYREVLAPSASNSSMVTVVGDVTGAFTGDAGEVQVSAYTTNDKTAPSTSILLNIAAKNFWHFKNIVFIGGNGNPRLLQTANSNNLSFTNCWFFSLHATNVGVITHTFTTATTKNILFDRCTIFILGTITITLPTVASTDYDANVVYRNCVLDLVGGSVTVSASGALSNKGGGVYFYNCFMRIPATSAIATSSANISTTYPVKIENCVVLGGHNIGTMIAATTSGQITERNNLIVTASPARSNVTSGTGTIDNGSYNPLFSYGQEQIWGANFRLPYTPHSNSGMLGFGSSGNGPTDDMLGITRPAGGGSANFTVGPYERADTFVRETTTTHTGSNAMKCVGPGVQTFRAPVDATSTTVTCYVRWDGTYTGTKPSMMVLNGTEVGVSTATTTAVGAINTWEQLSLTFTPTAKGVVDIRVISSDTAGTGAVYVDSFAIS